MKCILYILLFCSLHAISQNFKLDSISLTEVIQLEKKGDTQAASLLLLQKIKAYSHEDKNKIAVLYEEQYEYYFSLSKNIEEKESYSKKLVELREAAKNTDTLSLVKAYFYYSVYQNNIAINYKKALFYNEKAIQLWHKNFHKPTDLLAKIYTQNASLLHNLNFEGESFVAYEKAAKLYENIPNPDKFFLSALYVNLGTNYIRYGFYDKAAFYLSKAKNYFETHLNEILIIEKQENSEYSNLLHNYAQFSRLYKDTSNEKELIKIVSLSEDFTKNKKLSKRASYNLSAIYNYIGLYYLYETQDYKKALFYFIKAKNTIPNNYLTVYYDYYKINIAKAKIGLQKEEEALIELNYLIDERKIPKSLKGFIYAARSNIYAKNNNIALTLENANDAVFCFSKAKNKLDILSDSLATKYVPSKRLNDTKQLLNIANTLQNFPIKNDSILIAANNIYKIALTQFKNCYTKNFYSAKLEKMFNKITLGILETNKLRYGVYDAESHILKSNIDYKSKFLWHNFLVNNSNNILKIPDSLITLEQNLRKKLSLYESKKEEKEEEYHNQIIVIKEQLSHLSEKIQTQYASFSFFNQNNFNLSSFRENMDSQEVFLKYEKIDTQLFLYIIEKEKVSAHSLGNYFSIEKEIQSFLINTGDISNEAVKKLGINLYNKLGLKQVVDYENINIIPDKLLFFLPFDILIENNKYLIETKNIKYANSLPLLNFNPSSTKENKKNELTFFTPSYTGDDLTPLQGAEEETKKINKIINGTTFLGDQATKENFIKNTKNEGILHLAMHAFINNDHPELSNFVFSDSQKDYKLYISELYGLKFNANLAVLSACKTGVGGFKSGEGLVSLSRAFTFAGVPSTVSSLWSAPDKSTQEIMVSFYKNLKKGQSKSNALRNAKLTYLENTKNPNLKTPFYWAGFIMYGNDDTITFNTQTNYIWIGISILLLVFLVFVFRKRNLNFKK
ncbi:MAG: hypothetical protein COB12_03365 [Flavobacterium sp.]|nr:MAG: hypothetical protein COB12_03365 [Flavobacterium sp.]